MNFDNNVERDRRMSSNRLQYVYDGVVLTDMGAWIPCPIHENKEGWQRWFR
jgi:hypothetical protein